MRVIFMGTPDFAVPALQAIAAAGHDIAAVYSQPARPAGRGKKPRPSPVAQAANALALTVLTPVSLRQAASVQAFQAHNADIAVVVAYGLILPPAILQAPKLGCVNLHASLLPRWRGAAPIQRAIMAGDQETGLCVMRMEEGLDTGPVMAREVLEIAADETAGRLHDRLAAAGGPLLVAALEDLAVGRATFTAQPEAGVCYAHKIDKAETKIDWRAPAQTVIQHILGLSPVPGAWCAYGDMRLRILQARAVAASGPPGTVLDDQFTVACDDGAIQVQSLQRAGRQAVTADAFLRGTPVPAGTRLNDGAL